MLSMTYVHLSYSQSLQAASLCLSAYSVDLEHSLCHAGCPLCHLLVSQMSILHVSDSARTATLCWPVVSITSHTPDRQSTCLFTLAALLHAYEVHGLSCNEMVQGEEEQNCALQCTSSYLASPARQPCSCAVTYTYTYTVLLSLLFLSLA